jgi:hypothetical protein
MCAHNLIYSWFVLFLIKIFKAQQENLAAANKLKAERDPIYHSQQLEVIQLQQEFYAFYAKLPADFKKDNVMIKTTPTLVPNQPAKSDLVLLREDILRIMNALSVTQQ